MDGWIPMTDQQAQFGYLHDLQFDMRYIRAGVIISVGVVCTAVSAFHVYERVQHVATQRIVAVVAQKLLWSAMAVATAFLILLTASYISILWDDVQLHYANSDKQVESMTIMVADPSGVINHVDVIVDEAET